MRERLDCAILRTTCSDDWISPWLGSHAGGRLYIHSLDDNSTDIAGIDSAHALAGLSMRLRRFDACLIPVSESNLPWVSMLMSAAGGVATTPNIAFVRGLTAAALRHNVLLGLASFQPPH